MADPHTGDAHRLDDAAVEKRLARLDDLLDQLEQIPGRTAELAVEAVETLLEVYGEALARVTTCAGGSSDVLDALTGDELVRHLLLLHRIHPHPVEERVARAVDDVRAQLRSQGADVELVAVDGGVARVQISSAGCGSSGSGAVEEFVREQVLTAAPELAGVDAVTPAPAPALIPVTALLRRPADAAVGGSG